VTGVGRGGIAAMMRSAIPPPLQDPPDHEKDDDDEDDSKLQPAEQRVSWAGDSSFPWPLRWFRRLSSGPAHSGSSLLKSIILIAEFYHVALNHFVVATSAFISGSILCAPGKPKNMRDVTFAVQHDGRWNPLVVIVVCQFPRGPHRLER